VKLPLGPRACDALFELLAALRQRELGAVLVGGLVPPLLLGHLQPDDADAAHSPRRTGDCDLALGVDVGGEHNQHAATIQTLDALGWRADRKRNQFCWQHPARLWLDLIPVPAGIEAGDARAVAWIAPLLDGHDIDTFYRGYELALATAIDVSIEHAGNHHRLPIAGLAAMFAMKLQAWTDGGAKHKSHAHDVCWLLRYTDERVVVAALDGVRGGRPALVEEVVARLRASFADPWSRGVLDYAWEAFNRRSDDDTEADRNAVAAAATRVLALFDAVRAR
jgi:hypothetical protein